MSNKARKSMLVLSTLLVLSMLTGCMQMEVSLELYKDKTGSLSVTAAVMEDFTEEGQAEIIADDKLGTIDHDTEGITVIQEDLSYEYQGVKYVGSKETVQFDSSDILFEGYEDSELIRTDLGNGIVRIELPLETEGNADEVSEDDLGMIQFMEAMGGKIAFTFKTDYEVVYTNADHVKDGVYTWNLLTKLGETDYSAIIEYRETENVVETIISQKRLDSEEKIGVPKYDKDFHGKALEKLGILKGTDKGLELDKPLTRAEGVAVYARLLGVEDEIAKFNEENPNYSTGFTDVPNWVKPTINYLHSKGLVAGISRDKYGSDLGMTETQYATLVLRALGFSESKGEFTWDTASDKLKEIGFYNEDVLNHKSVLKGQFTRRGMAYISYNALYYRNNVTNECLIDSLLER